MRNHKQMLAIGSVALIAGVSIWSIYRHPVRPTKPPATSDVESLRQTCPPPPMPEAARLAGEHGRCRIRVRFNEFGLPDSAEVVRPSAATLTWTNTARVLPCNTGAVSQAPRWKRPAFTTSPDYQTVLLVFTGMSK